MYKIWDKAYALNYDPILVEIRSKRKIWFFWPYYEVWINNPMTKNWDEYERDLQPYDEELW